MGGFWTSFEAGEMLSSTQADEAVCCCGRRITLFFVSFYVIWNIFFRNSGAKKRKYVVNNSDRLHGNEPVTLRLCLCLIFF